LMFKPALFLLDPTHPPDKDIKEVYFAGNHGDVGGGWGCDGANYLLSDIPLKWMVEEVLALPDTENVLAWQKTKVDHMEQHETRLESVISLEHVVANRRTKANKLRKLVHDPLSFGGGLSWASTLSWWILEVLPFAYYELISGQWVPKYWPPNFGRRRDIPFGAEIHPSVQQMRRAGILMESDMPRLGGEGPYDPIPKSFFNFFKRRPKIALPVRNRPIKVPGVPNGVVNGGINGNASGGAGEGSSGEHSRWSLDEVEVTGAAKNWELV